MMALNLVIALLAAAAAPAAGDSRHVLRNDAISAEFDRSGLVRLTLHEANQGLALAGDSSAISVGGSAIRTSELAPEAIEGAKTRVTYRYRTGDRSLEVVYELKPGWQFVSKQLFLTLPAGSTCRVERVEAFTAELNTPVARDQKAANSSGAVFLRLGAAGAESPVGAFLALQNLFLQWERRDRQVAMAYAPDMEWRAAYGPFASDRVCIGVHRLSGVELAAHPLPEWPYMEDPAQAIAGLPKLDRAEHEAVARCVEAFALYRPEKSLRVHVPWCENDYQIDVATTEGRTEWKRIIDQCAAVGVQHALFTPANSEVAPLKDNTDAWGWENCLWLGLGQKIRRGEWNIEKDPIPPSIREMLDYARSKKIKLVAYVYPTLGWKQDPEWTAWCDGKTQGYTGVDTGVRSFQDWFVDRLVAFQKRTGISGYSFDHWWIAYEGRSTSKYAQWFGCRRILEELRRRIPDVVVDGRQQYQWFGPWTWLGGSYPHPTTTDEQPGSFENFADLHFSRVSADRQRWATWYYRVQQFTPWTLVPGYMTHQTPREDAGGRCVRDRSFNVRDWDYLGWRYSVISSLGSAPFNHVVNLLPARDPDEFKQFRAEDQRWLRDWMDWTDEHRQVLKNLRAIIGPPAVGRVDGSAAIEGDRGFVFLYNPNYRELPAEFTLGPEIGLESGDRFVLRELYPCAGRLLGAPRAGAWRRGERVRLPIKGPAARVLEVVPAQEVRRPALLNAKGRAALKGERLHLTDVEGPVGEATELVVLLPPGKKVSAVSVNGSADRVVASEGDAAVVPVTFAGAQFDHCQALGAYDPRFAGTQYRATATIPRRVFDQLAARRRAWPIPYTEEDLNATWRGSDRLLLFVQIADPDDRWTSALKIDGKAVELRKAYGAVYATARARTFSGFYADVSGLSPDAPHEFEVTLPEGLRPGQFQGLFFDNVETEMTTQVTK